MLTILLIFSIWHGFLSIFGIISNCLLIYLSVFKSPKQIRVYATFIINFAFTDVVACFMDVFVAFRLVPSSNNFVLFYVFNGLCQFTGLNSCKIGLSILQHCIPHGLWSLFLSFFYRYHILTNAGMRRRKIVLGLFLVYIPSLLQMLTFPFCLLDSEASIEMANQFLPNYNFTNSTSISVIDNVFSFSSMFTFSHICAPIFPLYILIFIMRRKIVSKLNESTHLLSTETKAIHNQLLKCLTYQSLIPAIMLISVILYLLLQFGIVLPNEIIEYSIIPIWLLIPCFSPFTYICFVRPYREVCKRNLVFCKKAKVASTQKTYRFESSAGFANGQKSQVSTIQC
ncbi:unnamed protein product [Caenorhabditis angaria]|uniref:G-protein coupled receptors family 1 profile domain-containing protein n=1 Tax=Caenorhabditis angaria TaxID=860376 RepID=A0A9P1N7M6_9PELO|nr:unnamed protein product [Caenorhabditis angaria]